MFARVRPHIRLPAAVSVIIVLGFFAVMGRRYAVLLQKRSVEGANCGKACHSGNFRHAGISVSDQFYRICQPQSVDIIAKMDAQPGAEDMGNAAAADVQTVSDIRDRNVFPIMVGAKIQNLQCGILPQTTGTQAVMLEQLAEHGRQIGCDDLAVAVPAKFVVCGFQQIDRVGFWNANCRQGQAFCKDFSVAQQPGGLQNQYIVFSGLAFRIVMHLVRKGQKQLIFLHGVFSAVAKSGAASSFYIDQFDVLVDVGRISNGFLQFK